MGAITDLQTALDRVAAADTQLDELGALVALERLVRGLTRDAVTAALKVYTPTEVARAAGTSRQAMAKRRPDM